MALSGHREPYRRCPLLGVKRTSPAGRHVAFDPKRTSRPIRRTRLKPLRCSSPEPGGGHEAAGISSRVLGGAAASGRLRRARSSRRCRRVGFVALQLSRSVAPGARARFCRRPARSFGYIAGRNVAIEYRFADGPLRAVSRDSHPNLCERNVAIVVTQQRRSSFALKLRLRRSRSYSPWVTIR